jgi:hypothetical protein
MPNADTEIGPRLTTAEAAFRDLALIAEDSADRYLTCNRPRPLRVIGGHQRVDRKLPLHLREWTLLSVGIDVRLVPIAEITPHLGH